MCLLIIIVQELPAEIVSDEPSDHEITRKVSVRAGFAKPSSSSLQSTFHQPLTGMDVDSNGDSPLPQHKHKTLAYQTNPLSGVVNSHPCSDSSHDNEVTTTCYQPEGHDFPCTSMNYTSAYTRDEKMLVGGPIYCEGLSGNIDDYSDYVVPMNYCMPEVPQLIMLDESPLVMQDGPSQTVTTILMTASGKKWYS